MSSHLSETEAPSLASDARLVADSPPIFLLVWCVLLLYGPSPVLMIANVQSVGPWYNREISPSRFMF